MKTLNDLNMALTVQESHMNEEIKGGAILQCSHSWTRPQLESWLPGYDFDMIDTVKNWLGDDSAIAEGIFLKVWVD